MKVKVEQSKAFNPVKIEITLESQKELDDLYHVTNHSDAVAKLISSREYTSREDVNAILYEIWRELNKHK